MSSTTASTSDGSSPSAGASDAGPVQHHILSVLVENRPGVLNRVAGLFARRGYNIHSLAVAPTEDPRFSRITTVVDVASSPLPQMIMQLDKLINVIEITELAPAEAVERELLLLTVSAPTDGRDQIVEQVEVFEARILDTGHDALTISLEGEPTKLDDFEELMRGFGLTAVQRTGRVALPKLTQTP